MGRSTRQGLQFKKTILSLLGWMVATCLILSGCMTANDAYAKENKKYASLVMHADTGMILHQRHADKKLHPASLTKVMTLLMVFEAIEQGKINYNTRIRISRHAASMVPSKIGLPAGASIKVKDAINVLVTKSANDIAVAVAEHLGRSEKSFANIMTRKARYIGMKKTTFRNASGLHDPKQITTARDMALLAQYIINKYPQFYKFYNQKSVTYRGKTYRNHNKLLGTYKGMDGMKTGYIRASGFNLIGSAVRNNQRIIGVVFGGRSGASRNEHMANLLDGGFARIRNLRIANSKVPLPPRKPGALLASNTQAQSGQNYSEQMASMGALIGEGDYDLDKIRRIETGMIAIAAHTGQQKQIAALQAKKLEAQRLANQKLQAQQATFQNASLNTGISSQQLNPAVPTTQRYDQALSKNPDWSVQVGAFGSRAATEDLLQNSISKLPKADFAKAYTQVAPLKTQDGWLFRGRLSGMTRTQALKACEYFSDCMPIAPQNQ